MHKLLRYLFNCVFGNFARKGDLNNLYAQITDFMQIERIIGSGIILKPLRGWALSPDAVVHILAELQQRDDPVMIEFGSGQSTVIFASYFKRRGKGRLISVEHDAVYAANIMKQIEALGLMEYVESHVVPLKDYTDVQTGNVSKSYDLTCVKKERKLDVVLVDGPPMSFGILTRYYPIHWSLENLAVAGKIFLDDADRPNERLIVQRVARNQPQIYVEELKTEKGLVALYFK